MTYEFVDVFFSFLDKTKINSKSIALLDLNFDFAFGRQMDSLHTTDSPKDIFAIFNNNVDSSWDYEFSEDECAYFINSKHDGYDSLKSLKKSDFIMNYNILYPYHFFKSAKNMQVSTPIISELEKDHRWKVLYA